jgi:nucleoside-diphosphate-sugar epimerase
MKTKTVLVTGGTGSLGRALVLHLSELGHWVRVLDLPARDFSPFEGRSNVEIFWGDIRDATGVRRAVDGVDEVIHLAALLPPASERDRQATMAVNVGGTENVVAVLESQGQCAHIVLSSSVCVYGDTADERLPLLTSHPLRRQDLYSESKIAAEHGVLKSHIPYTILRISGISVPALLEPPAIWPFMERQRIEFVCRTDVVAALASSVQVPEAVGKILHVSGGPTWRMTGGEYAAHLNEALGLPAEEARYLSRAGYFDWYDTAESQAVLGYQRTSFTQFLELLESAIEETLGGAP